MIYGTTNHVSIERECQMKEYQLWVNTCPCSHLYSVFKGNYGRAGFPAQYLPYWTSPSLPHLPYTLSLSIHPSHSYSFSLPVSPLSSHNEVIQLDSNVSLDSTMQSDPMDDSLNNSHDCLTLRDLFFLKHNEIADTKLGHEDTCKFSFNFNHIMSGLISCTLSSCPQPSKDPRGQVSTC